MVHNNKTVVILGMHRSGTSMVAGILQFLGLDMGVNIKNELHHGDFSQPFGYFENSAFYEINKRILESCGGSWSSPPSRDIILKRKDIFSHEIKNLVKKKQTFLWGWKDPRTVLTIELYLPYLQNPYFLICHRNKMEIAKSLRRREPSRSIEEGLVLTDEYNNRIVDFFKRFPRLPHLNLQYDEIRKNPRYWIERIAEFLGLSLTDYGLQKASDFIASNKKKQVAKMKYLTRNLTYKINTSILKRKIKK